MNVTAMFIEPAARACKTVYPGSIPGVASSFRCRAVSAWRPFPGRPLRHRAEGRPGEAAGHPGTGKLALSALLKPVRLCYSNELAASAAVFPGSSAVEQPAVNRLVAGSNPARGAKQNQILSHVYPALVIIGVQTTFQTTIGGDFIRGILPHLALPHRQAIKTSPDGSREWLGLRTGLGFARPVPKSISSRAPIPGSRPDIMSCRSFSAKWTTPQFARSCVVPSQGEWQPSRRPRSRPPPILIGAKSKS